MYAVYFAETFALALLSRDALKGRTKSVSTQMIVGLTLSIMAGIFNLPVHHNRTTKICVIIMGSIVGTLCSWLVFKNSEANGDDDFIIGRIQGRMSKLVPYVATVVMGLLSLFAACHFSVAETLSFMQKDVVAVSCTFQNYLHAFALLPQLLLCRRQGFVCPAAVKFLFLIGTKHIYEFTSDAFVSWKHYQKGRLNQHEFSFMSGDFVAAVILLDFLYLIATSDHGFRLIGKDTELELVEDAEAQVSADSTATQEPSKVAPKSIQEQLADFLEEFDGDSANLRKLLICTLFFSAATIGCWFGLISIYPTIFAGLAFLGWRRLAKAELPLPMSEKKQKILA